MELIINDVKLEGDLMDADFMEKFEQSMIKMRDTAQAKKRENFPTAAANYRAQCEVVNVCFDEIFGAGTADRLFHGKMNVMEHLKAIEKVSEWAKEEIDKAIDAGLVTPHTSDYMTKDITRFLYPVSF